MATTPNQAAIEAEILSAVNAAGTMAGIIDPELLPFIVLGRAVAAGLPGLLYDVEALIDGTEPSDADNAALAVKIVALGNPSSL